MSAIRWATAQNGNWGVAANWSPMTVPGISDDVTIDAYGTYTISIAPYTFVHTLDLDDTGATLALAGGADLIVAGDATFSGGQVTGNQGTLLLEGNTTVNGPTVIQGLLINNEGNLTISSYFRSDFGVGGVILDPGAVAEFSGAIPGSPGVGPIVFTAAGELVKFDGPIVEGPATISGFQRGDEIDLTGITATSLTYSNGNLALFNGSNSRSSRYKSRPLIPAISLVYRLMVAVGLY